MKKIVLLFLSVVASAQVGSAQTLQVQHTTFYSNNDPRAINYLYDVIQTRDKGFVFAGTTGGVGGGPFQPVCATTTSPPPVGWPVWGKLDSTGAIEWVKHRCDTPIPSTTVCQTPDGGYAVNGGTYPWNSMSIFRYGPQGDYLWRRDYGKNAQCGTLQIITTPDNGFLLLGAAYGIDSDITVSYSPQPPGSFAPSDLVLIKLDSLGDKQWVRTLGTSGDDTHGAAVLCDGKNYYLVATTFSNDHDFAAVASHPGLTIYTTKLDSAGNKLWSKPYGKGFVEKVLFDERDASIVVTGQSVGGHEFGSGSGNEDFFVMKQDTAGNVKWGKLYGSNTVERNPAVCPAPNGGYFLAGDRIVIGNPIDRGVLISIDSAGAIIDQREITSNPHPGEISYQAIFPVNDATYVAFGLCSGQLLSEGTGQNTGSAALIASKLAVVPLSVNRVLKPKNAFTFHPNPTHSDTELRLADRSRGGGIVVCTSADGKTLHRQRIASRQANVIIPTTGWAPGAYSVCWHPKDAAHQCATLIVR